MKRIEDYENFNGNDVNIDIALFKYNLIWEKNENCGLDEFYFIYGINGDDKNDYNVFQFTEFNGAYLSKNDFASDYYFDAAHTNSIEEFTGQSKQELIENFPYSVSDLASYFGIAHILGENTYGGFKIYNDEMLEYKIKNSLPLCSCINSKWEMEIDKNTVICKNYYFTDEGNLIDFSIEFDLDNSVEFKLNVDVDDCDCDITEYLNYIIYDHLQKLEF